MDSNVDVIELENSEDEEDDDANLTMEAVPFREKVEKWLLNCDGAQSKALLKDSERVVQKKTVVVKEVIDETESLHSVDTEQYIKSNRRKTTTKITTTTIKKYYSMVQVAKNAYNNNDDGDRQLLPTIDLASNDEEKYSCKVNRKRPTKTNIVPEDNESQPNRKKRNHQSRRECDDGVADFKLNPVPSEVQDVCHDKSKTDRKCRTPYNTRLSNEDVSQKIRLCTEAFAKSKNKKPKRSVGNKKQKQLPRKGPLVKLNPYIRCRLIDALPAKDSAASSKLKTATLRNPVVDQLLSSDSEEDILLTSYKPFSLAP